MPHVFHSLLGIDKMYLFNTFILVIIFILLPTSITFAESDSPSFQDGELTVPHVNTSELVGKFQDATFRFNEQTGSWDLIDFNEATVASIDQVEVIVTDSFPVQVFLEVFGFKPNPCFVFNSVNQRLEDNQFDITIPLRLNQPSQSSCLAVTEPFVKIIPLLVYGLDAGSYEYNVNSRSDDVFSGTFILKEDNRLPIIDETPTSTVELL